ncbi:MAG: hypothetical protein QM520_03730 [Gammaproteobacteria bacterium]|nr:hypothetical protein [Gammaproteobacteria bacterium]
MQSYFACTPPNPSFTRLTITGTKRSGAYLAQAFALPIILGILSIISLLYFSSWRELIIFQQYVKLAKERTETEFLAISTLNLAIEDILSNHPLERHQDQGNNIYFPKIQSEWWKTLTRFGSTDCMASICRPITLPFTKEVAQAYLTQMNYWSIDSKLALPIWVKRLAYWIEVLPIQDHASFAHKLDTPFLYRITTAIEDKNQIVRTLYQGTWVSQSPPSDFPQLSLLNWQELKN